MFHNVGVFYLDLLIIKLFHNRHFAMIKIFHIEVVLEIIIISLAKEVMFTSLAKGVMFLVALVCLFVCLFIFWWTTLLKKL